MFVQNLSKKASILIKTFLLYIFGALQNVKTDITFTLSYAIYIIPIRLIILSASNFGVVINTQVLSHVLNVLSPNDIRKLTTVLSG